MRRIKNRENLYEKERMNSNLHEKRNNYFEAYYMLNHIK